MKVELTSVSPVSFMLAKVGDIVSVKLVPPKPREYRDKIGPAAESFLIFKGQTKIGMIPRQFAEAHRGVLARARARICKMDEQRAVIIVEIASPNPPA